MNQGVGVLENVMNQHGVFANSMVDFCRQDTGIAFGASMDVFPLFQHLFRLGRFSEQPTLFRRDPFAGDTDLLTNPGRFGEERRQGFLRVCHLLSPMGSTPAVTAILWTLTFLLRIPNHDRCKKVPDKSAGHDPCRGRRTYTEAGVQRRPRPGGSKPRVPRRGDPVEGEDHRPTGGR